METKNIILLVVFIFGIVYMQLMHAQTVDEIIDKHAEAIGGKEKLNSIFSTYMEGTMQIMHNAIAIKITTVKDKFYKKEFTLDGHNGYIIITPNAGWYYNPLISQTIETISKNRLPAMQIDLDIAGPLIDYAEKGYKAGLNGKENIDGKDAYKIKITTNTGRYITYYLDTKTYLLIQTKQMSAGIGKGAEEKELATSFSDYKLIEGVMFAHTIISAESLTGTGSIKINKIELNKTIREDQYNPVI